MVVLRAIVERIEFDEYIADNQSDDDRDGENEQGIPHHGIVPQYRKNG